MIYLNKEAVSPVVGVMLMLVVTIVIAAVVSAFAGGLSSSEQKTISAYFSSEVNVESVVGTMHYSSGNPTTYTYPVGYNGENNYILFEHKGGDSFNLNDIEIQLENNANKMTFRASDKPVTDLSISCRDDPTNKTRFEEIGEDADEFIMPGDQFKMVFDGNYVSSYDNSKYLFFYKEGAGAGFGFEINKKYNYMIIDRSTKKVIHSGTLLATL